MFMYAHINTHAHSEVTESKDEEDFDQFLESVKARQLSLTAKGEPSLISIMYININISLVCTLSWFLFWLHIHLAPSYLCTQLYSSCIQQTFYRKKKKQQKKHLGKAS